MTTPDKKSLIALGVIMLQFVIFKQFYPHASFFQDSYTYIDAAVEGTAVSYRPIGYSWFLSLVHHISYQETLLVFIQYALLQLSGLYLYLTVIELHRPGKRISNIIFYSLLLNPLSLYVANAVSSDALFTSLTLLWLTELLKLMHRPGLAPLLRQLVLLVLIFYTRFNALYYPLVAAAACLMATRRWKFRLIGITATVLVVVACIKIVEHVTFKETGTKTFSAFSGWKIANNALYAYPYVKVDSGDLPSQGCRDLDRIVRQYFETSGPLHTGRQPDAFWYLWTANAPLKKYMRWRQAQEKSDYFTAWNRVGPVYSQYGYHIVLHHPLAYGQRFALGSATAFFYPGLEMLGRYNEGVDTVDAVAQEWFQYSSNEVKAADKFIQGKILAPFPFVWAFLNLAGITLSAFFLTAGRARWRTLDGSLRKGLVLTLVYCVINAGFLIFATPSVFRYHLAPLTWLFVFILLAYDRWPARRDPAPAASMG